MNLSKISLFGALFTTGLIAGLFYAYSCSVNPGLGKLSDQAYVQAMQSINVEIQNPVFFASFFGALILTPLAAWFNYSGKINLRFLLILAALIVYVIGTFGVTVVGNVPLNEKLAAFDFTSATSGSIKQARLAFESDWNRWHTMRTFASVIAFGLLGMAALLDEST